MKGSCLCGSIQYEVQTLSTDISHCYCHTCRKAHAAAFNTVAGIKPADLKWLHGESLLAGFESSPGKTRYFCSKCGSHIVAKKEGAPYWVLRLGTLDDPPNTFPSHSIWCQHKLPWLNHRDTHEWDTWPKD